MPVALLVDDNAENLYFLRCLLAADGFEIEEAKNGREALDRAKARNFDVVISDVLMPVMDGFSLCREWRSNATLRAIPFVFYTATYTDSRDEAFARSLGADDFIIKPIDPTCLRERIERARTRHSTPPPSDVLGPEAEGPYLQQYNQVLIRKLEDKLLELERTNRDLSLKDFALASSVNGILFAELDGSISYANPTMARFFGTTPESLVGRAVQGLIELPRPWTDWIEGGQLGQFDSPPRAGTKPAPWLRISAHFILNSANVSVGVMLSCVDITEERRLRQELSRIQRLEALGLFAAGVAHDFNNLLMAMFGALELESRPPGVDSDVDEYRAMALAAFDRAKDLTRRLLTFANGKVSKRRVIDLVQLFDESLTLVLSGSAIRCVNRYGVSSAMVNADAGQISQVFGNLLVNARQAMRDTGTIVVAIDIAPPGSEVRDAGRADDAEFVVVRISDDGPGIPSDVLPSIFEPYFTTKTQGAGLGLATSHTIVHEHGGHIAVQSEPGAGATFEVWLPVATGAFDNERPTAVSAQDPRGQGRILVMDDQVTIQALVQRALERAGYSVVVVGNGDQTLLEYERAVAAGIPFDMLILDVTVRGAMGGVETLRELRRQGLSVPVIAATGYSDEPAVERLLAQGFDRVLGKPFLMHELLSLVKALTANPRHG